MYIQLEIPNSLICIDNEKKAIACKGSIILVYLREQISAVKRALNIKND